MFNNKINTALKNNVYAFSIMIKVLLMFIGFVEYVLVARLLGAELKGEIAYIMSATSVGTIIFTMGIHQEYPYFRKLKGKGFKADFINAALLMIVFYALISSALIGFFVEDIRWRLIIALIPLHVFSKVITFMTVVEIPGLRYVTELVINVVNLLVVICFFVFFKPSLAIGVATLIIKDILMSIYYLHKAGVKITITRETFRLLLKLGRHGFFPMLTLLMTMLNYKVDVFMLNSRVSLSNVGIYSVGVTIAEQCWMIPEALQDIMISKLTSGKGKKEVTKVIRLCITVTLGVILGIILFGKPFINLFYGKEYKGSYAITALLLFGMAGMIYTKIITAYNIVHNKQISNLSFMTAGVVINIIMNMVLIPANGIQGAAVASVISYNVLGVMFITQFSIQNKISVKEMLFLNKQEIAEIISKGRTILQAAGHYLKGKK